MSSKLKKFFAMAAVIFCGAVTLSANIGNYPKAVIHCEKYKVKNGDTFWDVARYYNDLDDRNLYLLEYQDELRELNTWLKDSKNQLNVGDTLEIRYIKYQ